MLSCNPFAQSREVQTLQQVIYVKCHRHRQAFIQAFFPLIPSLLNIAADEFEKETKKISSSPTALDVESDLEFSYYVYART